MLEAPSQLSVMLPATRLSREPQRALKSEASGCASRAVTRHAGVDEALVVKAKRVVRKRVGRCIVRVLSGRM